MAALTEAKRPAARQHHPASATVAPPRGLGPRPARAVPSTSPIAVGRPGRPRADPRALRRPGHRATHSGRRRRCRARRRVPSWPHRARRVRAPGAPIASRPPQGPRAARLDGPSSPWGLLIGRSFCRDRSARAGSYSSASHRGPDVARAARSPRGDEGYAREEMMDELGAAFLSADPGLALKSQQDHAVYLASWITVLNRSRLGHDGAGLDLDDSACRLRHRRPGPNRISTAENQRNRFCPLHKLSKKLDLP